MMTGREFVLTTCLSAVAVLPIVAQQGVRVLSVDVQGPPRQPAQVPFLIPYSGDLGADTVVRVFRGTKQQQIEEIPRQTREGECVLYTTTVTYPVNSDGHMLHMDGVYQSWDLAWRASHQSKQVFTLVFERGKFNPADGQLRLSKSDVKMYFSHAIEWTMYATDDMTLAYEREKARNAPPAQGVLAKLGEFFGEVFKPSPVLAAVRATPVAAVNVIPEALPPIDHRPCNTVKTYSVARRAESATGDSVVADLTPVFAVRDTSPCAL